MFKITNLTNSPHDLVIRLPAMGTVTADFTPAYLDAMRGLGCFEIEEVGAAAQPDPLDHDGDGHKGGSAPAPASSDSDESMVALMIDSAPDDVVTFIDDGKPSESVLRTYIERKTGKKPHPNAKFETLIEKAKEAAQAGA